MESTTGLLFTLCSNLPLLTYCATVVNELPDGRFVSYLIVMSAVNSGVFAN